MTREGGQGRENKGKERHKRRERGKRSLEAAQVAGGENTMNEKKERRDSQKAGDGGTDCVYAEWAGGNQREGTICNQDRPGFDNGSSHLYVLFLLFLLLFACRVWGCRVSPYGVWRASLDKHGGNTT